MKFDIVIATYNRPESVRKLVNQINECSKLPESIIIVDSSDLINLDIQKIKRVFILRTSHKNQPYQRYLGHLACTSEWVVFFDDDMEVLDADFLLKLNKICENQTIAGIAMYFENKNGISSLTKIPQSNLFRNFNHLKQLKGYLSGYPELKNGKYGLCGNRGKQPMNGGVTEWVSGGAFAARRLDLYQNFNFQLFDIHENGLGMGEDGILGYTLSKRGRIISNKDPFFIHNDQNDSTYSTDVYQYARRVAFSRLYLSLEKTRLDNGSLFFARLHYHYYMFWRVTGLLINYMFASSEKRKKMLLGTLDGWKLTFGFKFDKNLTVNKYWHNEAMKDLTQNGISN
mgnify:CR=1 FL=1